MNKVISLEEALRSIKGALQVNVGYIHYLQPSEQRDERSVIEMTELGSIWLTHAPGKMKQKLSTALYPKSTIEKIIKENPRINFSMFTTKDNKWYSPLKEHQDTEYESDVWGDDWNDSPASGNAGRPYGATRVDLEPGDLVIVIKQGVKVALH